MIKLDNAYRNFFKSQAEAEEFAKAAIEGDDEMTFEVNPFQGGRFVVKFVNRIDGAIVRL